MVDIRGTAGQVVLESLAIVTSRRRVGLTVQPTRYGDANDRRVLCGWPAVRRGEQLRSFTAVHSAGAAEAPERALPAEAAARTGIAP